MLPAAQVMFVSIRACKQLSWSPPCSTHKPTQRQERIGDLTADAQHDLSTMFKQHLQRGLQARTFGCAQ